MSQADNLRVIEGEGGSSAEQPDPMVGQTIDGRYTVQSVLGEGGMGLVYKARHTVLGKPLALKVLRPDVSKDEEIMTRFRQEAQSASSIGNEHIIDISDFGTLKDGSTYFVMEYLDGIDLTGAIEQDHPMPPQRVVHIAKQICRALGAAHAIGIVHRDLKPDNIYLIHRAGDSDFVKVLDFGIAKVGGNASKLTRAGQVFGTPHYMSPEQCSGSGVDHRTDVYALGIIMYEMATGEVPFDADNLMGILTKHLYEEPIPPRRLNPAIPEGLEAVILKAIAKNADERYQTMAEVSADLDQVALGLVPFGAHPSTGGRPVGGETRALQAAALRSGRSKLLPIGLGLGVLAVGGVALALLLGGHGKEQAAAQQQVAARQAKAAAAARAAAAQRQAEQSALAAEVKKEMAAQPQAHETGARDTVQVTVQSDPPGAEVLLGQALVGNAPVQIPRPKKGATVALQLRKAGYQTQTIRISYLTAESVKVTLEPEQKAHRWSAARRAAERRHRHQAEKPKAASKSAKTHRPGTLPQTEVLDPWAN